MYLKNLEIDAHRKLCFVSETLFNRTNLKWDAILSMTKVELGLISDIDMYLCFEKGMRDGVSYISKNTVKTDNKYLTSYDPKNSTKCITYLDKKNLYGYAMSKPFPSGVFKWLDPAKFNLNKYGDDSLRGCVLEVDLEYPKELNELHNDCSLAPDKLETIKLQIKKKNA